MLGKLIPSAALKWFARKLFLDRLQDAYAGKMGESIKAALWWAVGKKTGSAVVVGALVSMAYLLGVESKVLEWVAWGAATLAAGGILDKALRKDAPVPFTSSPWYRVLVAHGPDIAAAIVAGLAWASSGTCTPLAIGSLTVSCSLAGQILMAVAGVLVYLGVFDAALLMRAPLKPEEQERLDRIRRRDFPGTWVPAVFLAVIALMATGCATGQFRVGRETKPAGIDLDTVLDRLCYGGTSSADKVKAAEVYIEQRGGKSPDQAEYIAQARKKPCPCLAQEKCANTPASPAPLPASP